MHNDLATGPALHPLEFLPFVLPFSPESLSFSVNRRRTARAKSAASMMFQRSNISRVLRPHNFIVSPSDTPPRRKSRAQVRRRSLRSRPSRPVAAHAFPPHLPKVADSTNSLSRKMAFGRPTRTPCAQEDGAAQATTTHDSRPPDSCFALVTPTISQAKARGNASSTHRFILGCAERPRRNTRRSRHSWTCSIRSSRCTAIDSSLGVFTGSTLQ